MEYIGTIFTIVFFAIVSINIIVKLKSAEGSGLQEKLNRGLAELIRKSSAGGDYNTDEVKIYDENGNEINFGGESGFEPERSDLNDVVIYDEDGNVMSPNSAPVSVPPPLKKAQPPEVKASTEHKVIKEADETEIETDAEMYRDFISSEGGSAIVIQEIMSKPLALR
jgi:hypothetical protein